jgi:RHS repeat-associated protein
MSQVRPRLRAIAAVTAATLCASVLAAQPWATVAAKAAATAPANAKAAIPVSQAGFVPSANGDIASLRTANTQTFPNTDGSFEARVYATPVNFKATDGSWQPINTQLVASGSTAHRTAAGDVTVTLPNNLSAAPVTVTAAGRTFGVQLRGASGTGTVAGPTETWPGALPGVDVALTDGARGVKETLTLNNATAQQAFAYTLTLPTGVTPTLAADGGVALSTAGSTIATLPAAFMDDASHTAGGHSTAVPYGLTQINATTWTLTMTPDAAWLTSSDRVWPVVIDPTVWINYGGELACQIVSTSATTNYCSTTTLGIGSNGSSTYRALVNWPSLNTQVPLDSDILQADFWAMPTSQLNGTSVDLATYQMTRAFTSAATWNTYDGTHAWTTAGGDFVSAYNDGHALLAPGTAGTRQAVPLTNLVSQWVNGSAAQYGVMIKVSTEPGSNVDYFASSADPTNAPELRITYRARLGQTPGSSFTSRNITDRQDLQVNDANGNLALDVTDLNLSAVGIPTTVSHTYNSRRADQVSTLGYGWVFDTGRDVRAYLDGSNNITYLAPGGVTYVFGAHGSTWNDAAGSNASVSYSGGQVTLTQHVSQEVDVFNTNGTLHTRTDRNGNTQTFNYNASLFTGDNLPYLDSITDTQGRTISFSKTYNQAGVGDGSGRAVTYGYSGNKLITFADGAHQTTTYTYDTTNRITAIQDPRGNTYGIGYDWSNRVTSIADPGGTCTAPTVGCTTFAYTNISTPGGTGTTVVTDPLGHATTYTWDQYDRITKTVDPLGHSFTTSWTANTDKAAVTDSQANTATMGHDALNNPTTTQAPTTGTGAPGAVNTLTYPTASGSGPYPAADYEPTTSTPAVQAATASSLNYDASGNLTSISAPAGSGGIALTYSYQGDPGVTSCGGHAGQLCKSTDADAHATSYLYNGLGQQTSITKPAPLGTTATTYDSVGRAATVTDPKGQKTTYTYDADDRVTEVQFGGINTCTSGDISAGNCLTYAYDGNGNLQTRVDSTGTTTYGYTALNQLNSKAVPGASIASAEVYDAAGNVTSYSDAGGTVGYVYDPANRLWALSEPGGSCPAYGTTPVSVPNSTRCTSFTVDGDGNRTKIGYPSGEVVNSGYDTAGRVTSISGFHNGTATAFFNRSMSYADSGGHDSGLLQTSSDGVGTLVTSTYGYDAYQRLTSDVVGSTTYGYTYDQQGNRLTATKTGVATQYYGYNNADQLCWSGTTAGTNGTTACPTTPTGDAGYIYDLNGNQTAAGSSTTASYNNQDQTTANVVSSSSTALSYAGAGQSERTSTGSTTLLNGLEGVAAQTGGSTSYFTRDPAGNLISMRQGAGGTSTNYYYLLDQTASVIALTAADGTTDTANYAYDPYGVSLSASGSLAATNPYRYATGYYDAATGSYKLGARYYAANLGRFTQQDPSGMEANSYTYSVDDPINGSDPSGLYSWNSYCGSWSSWCTLYFSREFTHFLGVQAKKWLGTTTAAIGAAFALACFIFGGWVAALCGAVGLILGGFILDKVIQASDAGACLTIYYTRSFKVPFGLGTNNGSRCRHG